MRIASFHRRACFGQLVGVLRVKQRHGGHGPPQRSLLHLPEPPPPAPMHRRVLIVVFREHGIEPVQRLPVEAAAGADVHRALDAIQALHVDLNPSVRHKIGCWCYATRRAVADSAAMCK